MNTAVRTIDDIRRGLSADDAQTEQIQITQSKTTGIQVHSEINSQATELKQLMSNLASNLHQTQLHTCCCARRLDAAFVRAVPGLAGRWVPTSTRASKGRIATARQKRSDQTNGYEQQNINRSI